MGSPTRLTQGLSSQVKGTVTGDFPFLDPFHTGSTAGKDVFVYATDYTDLGQTASYTLTGTATFAIASELGGTAVLTPSGTTTAGSMYRTASTFQFISGNKFWYTQRIKASAVAGNVAFKFGLQYGSATTDGLWFSKAAASTSVNLVSSVGSTATTLVTGITTAVAATYIDVGFYYDGNDLLVYLSDYLVARVTAPTIGASGTTLTNVLLAPFIQITPTATDTLTSDYVLVAQEMSR